MPQNDEQAFQRWYADWARKTNINPNPDDALQHYDYRAAFRAGLYPTQNRKGEWHWPSLEKDKDHPRRVVGGFDTVTAERDSSRPQADEQGLIDEGWDDDTAARLTRENPMGQNARMQSPAIAERGNKPNKIVEYEGTEYEFDGDATQDEIFAFLEGKSRPPRMNRFNTQDDARPASNLGPLPLAASFMPGGLLAKAGYGAGSSLIRSAMDDKPETFGEAMETAAGEGATAMGLGAIGKIAEAGPALKRVGKGVWNWAADNIYDSAATDILKRGLGTLTKRNLSTLESGRTAAGAFTPKPAASTIAAMRTGVQGASRQLSSARTWPGYAVAMASHPTAVSGAAQQAYRGGSALARNASTLRSAGELAQPAIALTEAARRQAMIDLLAQEEADRARSGQ